jgi:2-polyprenyl-6-methoxyphenol hydroxylase-like FAD-dependent oxidoreductase
VLTPTDAKPASLDLGRADALNARTQQYFEVANLLDDLLPQGLKCNSVYKLSWYDPSVLTASHSQLDVR